MRLVIIGAGFAGMYAALSAARLRDIQGVPPESLEIALVAPEPVLVVRPQPGHAVTIGVKARSPMVWSSSCATTTSRVRSPPGSGVRLTTTVNPVPAFGSTNTSTRSCARRSDS